MKRMNAIKLIVLAHIMASIRSDLDPDRAYNDLVNEHPKIFRFKHKPEFLVKFKDIYINAKSYYNTTYDVLDDQGRLTANEINNQIESHIKNML